VRRKPPSNTTWHETHRHRLPSHQTTESPRSHSSPTHKISDTICTSAVSGDVFVVLSRLEVVWLNDTLSWSLRLSIQYTAHLAMQRAMSASRLGSHALCSMISFSLHLIHLRVVSICDKLSETWTYLFSCSRHHLDRDSELSATHELITITRHRSTETLLPTFGIILPTRVTIG
jgi:hypothetical protein